MRSFCRLSAVLLTFLLVLGTFQCVMSCTGAPCAASASPTASQSKLPPCHRHRQLPTDEASRSCSHPLLVADTSHVFQALSLAPQWVPVATASPARFAQQFTSDCRVVVRASSPPRCLSASSVILRI
jgi:hypothetical protein